MKRFTFHIDSTALIQAETEEKAKDKLIEALGNHKTAHNEDMEIIEETIEGAEVGELICEENEEE